jgi:hypothetical protein
MPETRLFTLGNSFWFAQLTYTDHVLSMKGVASVNRTTALSTALLYNVFNIVSMDTQLIGHLLSPVSSQHTIWALDVCPGAVFWLSDWLP